MIRVEDHHRRPEIGEAGSRRYLIVYEDVCLLNISPRDRSKQQGSTDAFEVTMNKIHIMNVPETLGHAVQLHFMRPDELKYEEGKCYQFQPIGVIRSDILHDVSTCHQFRDCRKMAGIEISQDAEELQDIWVALSPTNRIALADITEDMLKPYAVNHYTFEFNGNKLVRFEAEVYGRDYSSFKEGNTISLGSLRNKSTLTLPCSVEGFEKVFGEPDEIDRMHMW